MPLTPVNKYHLLKQKLEHRIDAKRIIDQPDLCLAYGSDASFYRLVPKLVLRLKSIQEVIFTLKTCTELRLPVTFRAAGTSLSGQALSDSVLITLTDDWRGHKVLQNGEKIRLQPGVIGADANRYLLPYQRKIGPDPASINSCKIGGIASNNASGMCCGTAQNSYRTVDSMKIVFSDGTMLDTGDDESIHNFKHQHSEFIAGIEALCEHTQSDAALCKRIYHKYRLKNTTGYALNALVDYQSPIDVIEHLMIGSEGTLGFIAEITYRTVKEQPFKASALLVFADIDTASQAVSAMAKTPVAAVELMDGRSLRSIAGKPGMADFIANLDLNACALLVESHADSAEQLDAQCQTIMAAIAAFERIEEVAFTCDSATVSALWQIRKGLFPAVGAVRSLGTTVIIEDVAFPVAKLAGGIRDLQALFDKYRYQEAIIFGHALDGNLHFVFTQSFETQEEISRYGAFMQDVSELVAVKYQGSLKAEHGTGRNMAPFIELEWGKQGLELMQKIKALFDPHSLLNPGVIINANPNAHLEHLKPMPATNSLVDPCIECGFCESVCPSRTLSLSPRQRIILYRELARRRSANQSAHGLTELFQYQGIDTCAATGLCAERCPVGINTGELIKQLRARNAKGAGIAHWSANHFSSATRWLKVGLAAQYQLGQWLPHQRLSKLSLKLRAKTANQTPIWLSELPNRNRHHLAQFQESPATSNHRKVVYLPSCISRTMGSSRTDIDKRSLTEVTTSLLTKAGYDIITAKSLNELCCGLPYASKGFADLARQKAEQLEQALWQASRQGEYPVLMDTSPCVKQSMQHFTKPMTIFEPSEFVERHLIEHLNITPVQETVMLHITCSAKRMGLEQRMLDTAKRCASEVIVAEHIDCCGWAGDKGLFTPELNAAALAPLKAQIPKHCKRGFSNSRSCEIGLSHHSGISYQSILYLVDQASSAK
ncbi:D-lactate dehydrogenase [Vibrio xiamenensis]|uniref:D-lactate dehydrogenase (cytochrome) n=1 Tax=Vibrio xiamenensis TaxID=861298 RepID=A0A1G8ESL8_9VIBR|nr:FAD-binding and (Fe-S)-binding domain-containing protein [Vibrio xiamenensis]SDH72908.1 D-lactate dehydrogenase [Vibrio xiamenensis]